MVRLDEGSCCGPRGDLPRGEEIPTQSKHLPWVLSHVDSSECNCNMGIDTLESLRTRVRTFVIDLMAHVARNVRGSVRFG